MLENVRIHERKGNRRGGLPIYAAFLSLAVFFSFKIPQSGYSAVWVGWKSTDLVLFLVILAVAEVACWGAMKGLDVAERRIQLTSVSERNVKGTAVKASETVLTRRNIISVFFAIFCSWLPFFLSFYPGNLSPDSYSSIHQALSEITSSAHPVLFTLMVRACLKMGLFCSKMI